MRQLKFASISELAKNPPKVISVIGGGGKSTIISKLASELASAGQKVLITTTTKFYPFPGISNFTAKNESEIMQKLKNYFINNDVAVYGKCLTAEGKLEGINSLQVLKLKEELPVIILVEADGSRGLPVKGYNPDEPVIPGCTDLVIALAGADAIGKPFTQEFVHRPKQLAKAIKVETSSLLTEKKLALVFSYMQELTLKQAPQAEIFFILNKLDLLKEESSGMMKLAKALSVQPVRSGYLLGTEANSPEPVKAIFNIDSKKPTPAVAAVVLAAGSAKRMGKDKLKLPYGKHTILEQTLEKVKNAAFDEIILVVKPGSDWAVKLKNSGYIIVENHEHSDGQSSSLKAGLRAVSSLIQGVMFVLGDQPAVPPLLYNKLIGAYRSSFKLATAPVYKGKRGNPTIFDRRTWPMLLKLSGDEGGRSLFNHLEKGQLYYFETEESSVLADIDTVDDYHNFLQDQDSKKRI